MLLLLWGPRAGGGSTPPPVLPGQGDINPASLGGGQIVGVPGRAYSRKRIEGFIAEIRAAQDAARKLEQEADKRRARPRKVLRKAATAAEDALVLALQQQTAADTAAAARVATLMSALRLATNEALATKAIVARALQVEAAARELMAELHRQAEDDDIEALMLVM